MRCKYHQPDPRLVEEQEGGIDPEFERPLVATRLEEQEMQFGYMEDGVKKSALVKVTLCRKCSLKLRYGKEKSKQDRQATAVGPPQDAGNAVATSTLASTTQSTVPDVSDSDSDGYTPAPPPDLDRRPVKVARRSSSPVRGRSHV